MPNSDAASVSVIDPTTLKVVDRFSVGVRPHHVTPSWDLTKLYVNNTEGNTLTEIDPVTGRPVRNIPITDPYNLYFTPDGTKAIVVAERYQRLDFYNPADWSFIKSVGIPWAGVDHADFTADGRYFIASCEFSGQVVKVDTEAMEVVGRVNVGSLPIDVKLSPDGTVLYVANQGRHGVSLVYSRQNFRHSPEIKKLDILSRRQTRLLEQHTGGEISSRAGHGNAQDFAF